MWQVIRRYQGVDERKIAEQQQQVEKEHLRQKVSVSSPSGARAQIVTPQTQNQKLVAAGSASTLYASSSAANPHSLKAQLLSQSSKQEDLQQGLSQAERDRAFAHNQRTMAATEWHEHAVNPNPSPLSVPYDRFVFEKMLRLAAPLVHPQQLVTGVELQQKSLANLIQLVFEKPHNVHHLLKEPQLVTSLISTAQDPDQDVRKATCVLIRLIAQDIKGAAFLFTQRKDDPALPESISRISSCAISCSSNHNNTKGEEEEGNEEMKKRITATVQRRLADVGGVVRCVLTLCLDESCQVAAEALKAMSVFHGFADTPEYTFTLMRAMCVPVYAHIISRFKYDNNNNNQEQEEDLCSPRALECAAALRCLRFVTNAKEAFLEVLKCEVLGAALQIIIDFDCASSASLQNPHFATMLCAAFNLVTELVLYTAGSNAAARRQKSKLPTLLPCARLSRVHPDANVRRDAAGALATLSVAEGGKAAALREEEGVIRLVQDGILAEENRHVVSSMCRVVCLLSELPAAREQLRDLAEHLDLIAQKAAQAKDGPLEEGAARAKKLVLWVPGAATE